MDTRNPSDKPKLLQELADIKSLLGDDDIPLIKPETQASAAAPDIPTLSVAERARSTRNPFLQSGPVDAPADIKPLLQSDPSPTATPRQPVPSSTNPFLSAALSATGAQAPTPAPAGLDHREQQRLVNELLAAWMPRIEQELRQRLLDALNNKS